MAGRETWHPALARLNPVRRLSRIRGCVGETLARAKRDRSLSSDGMRGKNPELDGSVLYDVGHNI